MTTSVEAPIVDWLDPVELDRNPYPSYERLRATAPVAWVPAFNRYLITTFSDCFSIEMDQVTFSSREDEAKSTMVRAMGRTMLRKDDPDHQRDRDAFGATLRPLTVRRTWREEFVHHAARHLARLRQAGPGVDLQNEFAVPYVADCLATVVGFRGVDAATIKDWSHTLVAGVANVGDEPSPWAEAERVRREMDIAIDEAVRRVTAEPDESLISSILRAPHTISDEDLRANVRLTIAGGMNEPSHVLSSAVWALATNPTQHDRVRSGDRNWGDVFEETARLMSPVGMYPRRVTADTEVRGVSISAGSTVGLVIASANRDENQFYQPEKFDLDRERQGHLAFGNGTHICAGNWTARGMVGDVALPMLYEALPGLTVEDPTDSHFRGWVFRGPDALPVRW